MGVVIRIWLAFANLHPFRTWAIAPTFLVKSSRQARIDRCIDEVLLWSKYHAKIK